jgi:hypothetical protein
LAFPVNASCTSSRCMRAQPEVVKAHCIATSDESEFRITEGRVIWTVLCMKVQFLHNRDDSPCPLLGPECLCWLLKESQFVARDVCSI